MRFSLRQSSQDPTIGLSGIRNLGGKGRELGEEGRRRGKERNDR